MKILTTSAFLAAYAFAAQAGGSYDSSGVATGITKNVVKMASEGHVVMQTMGIYETVTTDDPDNPMNGLSGECFGALEIKGTTATGGGLCVFRGDGEDAMSVRWTAEGMTAQGALAGRWNATGGTGALAGATGGGSFHSLTNMETGTFENTLTGALTVP